LQEGLRHAELPINPEGIMPTLPKITFRRPR
jgi:hypothetical protein